MKKHFLLLLTTLFLFAQGIRAQHEHDGHIRCGTMQHLEWLQEQDPSLEQRLLDLEETTQQWIKDNPNYLQSKDILISIPVVVHVVWKTSAQNIPDNQIISQIEVLNEDYRRLNSDTTNTPSVFQGVAADVEIEFCLATTDPEGNPTTGIVRTETTVNSFSSNNAVKFTAQGGDDAWPAEHYLNIWVCNLGGGLLGYAQFPNMGSAATDGVVIGYPYFGYNSPGGYPYNKGRTATHEIGHWLNLYHIWGDDGGACWGTDYVPDTPNQGGEYYGCPPFPQNSCSSDDMFQNYMDYTDDGCMNIFTAGQKLRMHAAINSYRSELFESLGCVSDLPVAAFSANHTEIPVDCGVDFTDLSTNEPTAWLWTFEGGTPATSTEQHPSGIVYENPGTFDVSLEVENASGSGIMEMENFISVGSQYTPEVEFMASQQYFCSDSQVLFTDLSTACPIAWEWTFEPSWVSFINGTGADSQHPEVMFDFPGTYTVTLKATNVNGEGELTKTDYLFAGGKPLPFLEEFEEDSISLAGWTVVNQDEGTTWVHSEAIGNEPGTKAMSLYFHEVNSVFERDQLISPVLNLSEAANAALTFKHAYAQYQPSLSDSLIVYVSNDCGDTWHRVFGIAENGSGNFATAEPSSDEFFPESSADWCGSTGNPDCLSIDVTPWVGSPNFQVMFESFDLYGNKIYLDDVELIIYTGESERMKEYAEISVYPIPADDYLQIDYQNTGENFILEVLNIQGKILYTEKISAGSDRGTARIDLSGLKGGIYFIRVGNDAFSTTRRVIVR